MEDSDEENIPATVKEEDEDDFTPAPQRSPKRASRRRATDMPSTPRGNARTRRAKTGDNVEPSEIFEIPPDAQSVQGSPSKRGSPQKRKSAAVKKKGRVPSSEDTKLEWPTSEPTEGNQIPLADITESANNKQGPRTSEQKAFVPLKPMDAILEKPMDIVIRSRALAAAPKEEDIGPRPRMVMRSLVLTNFKSYAGRQEVGPFHASFSSVVGPNGSGKSNVIDSLLFVFGFRASKMRQGKISALIHNSAAFPDLGHCEVEVHFQEVLDQVGTHAPTLVMRI